MRTLGNGILISRKEMSKQDYIETILYIIRKILDYTSSLNKITPTLFDKKIYHNEDDDSDISTNISSNEDNNSTINTTLIKSTNKFCQSYFPYLEFFEKRDILCGVCINSIVSKEDKFTLTDFLYFWVEQLEFEENLLILTMMNIDKILSKEFILTFSNVKNVLFTCMVITQKYYEDENFTDKDYSKIINIDANELIQMEIEFLSLIDFSLHISDEEFNKYKNKIKKVWENNLSFFTFT